MKTFPSIRLISLLSFGLSCFASAENLTVEKLAAGETIKIEYASLGCFHQNSETYQIKGGEEKSFTRMASTEVPKTLTGKLTAAEIKGLDGLFAFYREEKREGCTTVDEIKVSYERNGKVIGQESFIDGSCASSNRKNVVSFYIILERLKQQDSK